MERIKTYLEPYPLTKATKRLPNIKDEPERDRRKDLLGDLGLPDPPPTLDSFRELRGTGEALGAVRALVSGDAPPLLLIYGGTGNGKTHLLQGLVVEYHRRHIFSRYQVWTRIVGALRQAQRDSADPDYYELIRRYCQGKAPLIIDDIGMGTTGTNREWADLEDIVNARYNDRLVTVMATNKELEKLPPRVVSRFIDPDYGLVVLNAGADYRMEKREHNR